MTVPVFEEFEPAADCDCQGCAQQRRALAAGGHPAAHGCRRALVAFTAAGMALTSGAADAAAVTGLPAGPVGPEGSGSAGPAVSAGPTGPARPDRAAARDTAAAWDAASGTDGGADRDRGVARDGAAGAGEAAARDASAGAGEAAAPGTAAGTDGAAAQDGAAYGDGVASRDGAAGTDMSVATDAAVGAGKAAAPSSAAGPDGAAARDAVAYRDGFAGLDGANAWDAAAGTDGGADRDRGPATDAAAGAGEAAARDAAADRGRGVARDGAAGAGKAAAPDPAAARGTVAGADRVVGSGAGGRRRIGGDPEPGTEQGGRGPLHGRPLAGPSGKPATLPGATPRQISRAEIINRAKRWVSAEVPYSMEKYWSDGYRQDCSGFVSMAWNLAGNEWTGSLAKFGTRILREDLLPGDILLFHNPSNPTKGSHVTIFGGWIDYTHAYYLAYEQAPPHARGQATPMAYWNNSGSYVAYRYKSVSTTGTGDTTSDGPTSTVTPYPGAGAFGPGTDNKYVTQLGEMLVERGGKRFYNRGPGPRWAEADRRATEAFQLAQGWEGADADGLPGPVTWRLLVTKQGRNIPAAGATGPGGTSAAAPKFPGRGYFRPGQSNAYVTQLGRQLVKRGHGKHYRSGPGPRWGEADRRNVEAFQRAQGWRGAAADGFPGPETWRRLFA